MKLFNLYLIFFALGWCSSSWSTSLLELSKLKLSSIDELELQWKSGNQTARGEAILSAISAFDHFWKESTPHQAISYLKWGSQHCEEISKEDLIHSTDKELHRLGLGCLLLESEWINRISPWEVIASSQKIELLKKLLENPLLPLPERLYVEGRFYSALPPLYGQDLKKALVALEMLRRTEDYEPLCLPWIQRIRKMQGKWNEPENPIPPLYQHKDTDGLPISFFPLLMGNYPQGFGLQLRAQDSAIRDKQRRIQGRIFGTHRGSIGGEVKYEDHELWPNLPLNAYLSYLHGVQEHHGVGIEAPTQSSDFYIERGILDLHLKQQFTEKAYFKLGYRFHSSHLRKIEGESIDSNLPQLSNAFDSGIVTEMGWDTRDSEYDSYRGIRASIQAYLPRKSFGSPRSFERILLSAEDYRSLGLKLKLKTLFALATLSDNGPFHWFSQMSGTFPFSGLRPTRYIDRSLVSLATELRWKSLGALTLFGYANMGTVSSSLKKALEERYKLGVGVGAEIHLTRFRVRAFRAELGIFGGELTFNSTLGFPIS